jgi:hypothetical protein
MDPRGFSVQSVMVHDVPAQRSNQDIVLTDGPITLDDDLRGYFAEKIISSLVIRGLDVVADANGDPTVRAAAIRVIEDASSLPDQSQVIARKLDDIQDARNPAGLVAVVAGVLDGARSVAILKLEREEGLRVRIRTVAGQRTIDMEHLRDLTLTDKTKVFKTALLGSSGGDDADGVHGRASDDQRSIQEGEGVANFFLAKFLGCKLKVNPEIATRDFFEAVQTFINEDVASPEKRARYHLSLLHTLEDQARDIRPRSFVESALDDIDQPALLERLVEKGLQPGDTFARDVAMIEKRLKGFKIVFDSGIVVVGGPDDLRDRIALRDNTSARPGADITDTIRRLQGR